MIKFAKQIRIVGAVLVGIWVGSMIWGCGSQGNGASTRGTVTVRTDVEEAAAANGAADGGGSEVPAGGTGTFRGQVVLDGPAPSLPAIVSESTIKPQERAVCVAKNIKNQTLEVENGKIKNVFVFLDKAPRGVQVDSSEQAEVIFDNQNCMFDPHGMFIRVGQVVRVTNSDGVAHNTHTLPVRNRPFNNVIKINDQVGLTFQYDKPEKQPVEVKCDFHPWMKAYHLVLDHPWGAVTKADGTFEIKDLPAGSHKFKIWHEKVGWLDRGFRHTVKGDDDPPVEIKYSPDDLAGDFDGPRPRQVYVSSVR